jgi:hypothetical protein
MLFWKTKVNKFPFWSYFFIKENIIIFYNFHNQNFHSIIFLKIYFIFVFLKETLSIRLFFLIDLVFKTQKILNIYTAFLIIKITLYNIDF